MHRPRGVGCGRLRSVLAISQVTKSGKPAYAAISPDGKYIAMVVNDIGTIGVNDTGKGGLWLHNVQSNSDAQVLESDLFSIRTGAGSDARWYCCPYPNFAPN